MLFQSRMLHHSNVCYINTLANLQAVLRGLHTEYEFLLQFQHLLPQRFCPSKKSVAPNIPISLLGLLGHRNAGHSTLGGVTPCQPAGWWQNGGAQQQETPTPTGKSRIPVFQGPKSSKQASHYAHFVQNCKDKIRIAYVQLIIRMAIIWLFRQRKQKLI